MFGFKNTWSVWSLFLAVAFLFGCGEQEAKESAEHRSDGKPELLIYCGITMIAPMSEIAAIIEKQENCHIHITKGGSGNLLRSILLSHKGDLYLPGSDRYYATIDEEHEGLVLERVEVGQNKAVLLVQKGNPDHLTSDLKQLTDPHIGVVIGDPDSGSIGEESRTILERAGIFEEVVKNVMLLATDSKDILKCVKTGEADIGMNWYATSTWGDNSRYIDVIEIDPALAKEKKLVLGMLSFTENPEICRAFMALASSEQGHQIFRKHGLYFDH